MRLGDRRLAVGDVAQPEGNGDPVGAGRGKGQGFGIADAPADPPAEAVEFLALATGGQHRLVDVGDHRLAATGAQEAKADIAGAAGEIDQCLVGLRCHPVDHRRLPQPVDAAAHKIVHQVVARRHRIKNTAHKAGLVRPPHGAEAEIDILVTAVKGRHVAGAVRKSVHVDVCLRSFTCGFSGYAGIGTAKPRAGAG